MVCIAKLNRFSVPTLAVWLIMYAFSLSAFALQPWPALLDSVKSDSGMQPFVAPLIEKAREAAALPVIKRPATLAEVGQNRTWLDGRSNALEDEIRGTFALAMADFAACNTLAQELPLLAAAYRLTGEQVFLDRVVAQLEETASWSPLQRPGWTLYAPGHRLPPDGKDGNWLATGCGVRAMADTLAILPEGALDTGLIERIHALLEKEIAGVVDDWEQKRPWFVRTDNPVTNQWVLPTEGLVRACLVLDVETHRDAYELGVRNLLRALDAHGVKGEFEEGFGYAGFTVTSLAHAAFAMAVAGDRRAIDHPFLKHFPAWYVHHLQPGKMVINCFDAGGAYDKAGGMRPLLSLLAICTGDSVCLWGLDKVGGPSDDLPGLAARGLPADLPRVEPPLFAQYDRAARVNWRSSWDDDATGVWVRGGHPLDQHDHQDRGHVNFILRGRPVLIEAGTPAYHHPLMMTHYATGVGHNVLQLGTAAPERKGDAGEYVWFPGWQKRGGVAPITVSRMDNDGGEVVVDGTDCYEGLSKWNRHVTWTANTLDVSDTVTLAEGVSETVLFRWHLGVETGVSLSGTGTEWNAEWEWARLRIGSDATITVEAVPLPDHTLQGHTGENDPGNTHVCLEVRTAEPVQHMTLHTAAGARS